MHFYQIIGTKSNYLMKKLSKTFWDQKFQLSNVIKLLQVHRIMEKFEFQSESWLKGFVVSDDAGGQILFQIPLLQFSLCVRSRLGTIWQNSEG